MITFLSNSNNNRKENFLDPYPGHFKISLIVCCLKAWLLVSVYGQTNNLREIYSLFARVNKLKSISVQ